MIPKDRKNAYVHPAAPEPNKFRAGFGYLLAEAKRLGAKEAWIVAPQKGTYTGGHIEAALPNGAAKALLDGKKVTIDGVQIIAHYATRLPSIGNGSPMLAAYLSASDIESVDDLYEVPSLVVVPFAVDIKDDVDTKNWREKWPVGMVSLTP